MDAKWHEALKDGPVFPQKFVGPCLSYPQNQTCKEYCCQPEAKKKRVTNIQKASSVPV
jgi:hypothetical protein